MGQKIKRILLADDEEAILFAYRKFLQGAWVELDTCMNIESALELLEANSYEAVITDLRFSHSEDQGGLDILQYVRQYKPATSVILITAYGSDEIKQKVLSLGARFYMEKPFPPSTLCAKLHKLGIPTGEF